MSTGTPIDPVSRVTLSVVTPCYNDHDKFRLTVASLRDELTCEDEWVVIDSSIDLVFTKEVIAQAKLACRVRYMWELPRGVYSAQNHGIRNAKGAWIQIINSGDAMSTGGRKAIAAAISNADGVPILVFAQRARDAAGDSYVFRPTANSVWPHQSIIVRSEIYSLHGMYDDTLRYSSEQKYFANVRRTEKWRIHEFVLTEYLLGGISSQVNLRQVRESYGVRRALGQGRVHSLLCSVFLPSTRKLLELILGQKCTNSIKRMIFAHYSKK